MDISPDLSRGPETELVWPGEDSQRIPDWVYTDASVYAREVERIFHGRTWNYVGLEAEIPNAGDFIRSNVGPTPVVVSRAKDGGIAVFENRCVHRAAEFCRELTGNVKEFVCPYHQWTYDLKGQLIGAPHFAETPCLNLSKTPLQNWNGLLFEQNGYDVMDKLKHMEATRDLDFSGYMFDHVEIHECDYNWKTFIEVYLEDYHVGPFHPGLGNFVTCDDLRWEMGAEYSVQTVGVAKSGSEALGKAGSPVYRAWQDQVLKYQQGTPPKHGAIWLTYYPGVMVEWYPNVLVVSTLYPRGPQKTLNVVEFYYPEEIHAFEREFIEAEQAAYWETCAEDDEIALRMDAGRRALMERGDDEVGPYQSPMEDGMQQFHEWYRSAMKGEP